MAIFAPLSRVGRETSLAYDHPVMLKILVTNDDGIESPGLKAAVEAALPFGQITVVAPLRQQTAMGRALLGRGTERLREVPYSVNGREIRAFTMDATPALTIKFAFASVFKPANFDLAVSGINYGENMGADITMSGTLGAVFETASKGIPGIAASRQIDIAHHYTYSDLDWSASIHFLSLFIERFRKNNGFTGFDILKIDIPEEADKNTLWVLTRLSRTSYFISSVPGEIAGWEEETGYKAKQGELPGFKKPGLVSKAQLKEARILINKERISAEEGTDSKTLLFEGKVAVTPLITDFSVSGRGNPFFNQDERL